LRDPSADQQPQRWLAEATFRTDCYGVGVEIGSTVGVKVGVLLRMGVGVSSDVAEGVGTAVDETDGVGPDVGVNDGALDVEAVGESVGVFVGEDGSTDVVGTNVRVVGAADVCLVSGVGVLEGGDDGVVVGTGGVGVIVAVGVGVNVWVGVMVGVGVTVNDGVGIGAGVGSYTRTDLALPKGFPSGPPPMIVTFTESLPPPALLEVNSAVLLLPHDSLEPTLASNSFTIAPPVFRLPRCPEGSDPTN